MCELPGRILETNNMGSEQKRKRMGTEFPTKKTSRLSLALRSPNRNVENPMNPLGRQNSLEDCKPILGHRLACGWGWASRRPSEAAQPSSDST